MDVSGSPFAAALPLGFLLKLFGGPTKPSRTFPPPPLTPQSPGSGVVFQDLVGQSHNQSELELVTGLLQAGGQAGDPEQSSHPAGANTQPVSEEVAGLLMHSLLLQIPGPAALRRSQPLEQTTSPCRLIPRGCSDMQLTWCHRPSPSTNSRTASCLLFDYCSLTCRVVISTWPSWGFVSWLQRTCFTWEGRGEGNFSV